jgi:hypothetical protein
MHLNKEIIFFLIFFGSYVLLSYMHTSTGNLLSSDYALTQTLAKAIHTLVAAGDTVPTFWLIM